MVLCEEIGVQKVEENWEQKYLKKCYSSRKFEKIVAEKFSKLIKN